MESGQHGTGCPSARRSRTGASQQRQPATGHAGKDRPEATGPQDGIGILQHGTEQHGPPCPPHGKGYPEGKHEDARGRKFRLPSDPHAESSGRPHHTSSEGHHTLSRGTGCTHDALPRQHLCRSFGWRPGTGNPYCTRNRLLAGISGEHHQGDTDGDGQPPSGPGETARDAPHPAGSPPVRDTQPREQYPQDSCRIYL